LINTNFNMKKTDKELKNEEPNPKASPELSAGESYWKKLQALPYSNDRIGQGFVIGIPLMKPNTETSTNEKPEGK